MMQRLFHRPVVPALWRAVLPAVAAILVASGASAAERHWRVNGSGTEVVATDCTDCGHDIGMLISCRGAGAPAQVTVQWAAAKSGKEGAGVPLELAIAGAMFKVEAHQTLMGQVGFVPVFKLGRKDALLRALIHGKTLVVHTGDTRTSISLRGSSGALAAFASECGWNRH